MTPAPQFSNHQDPDGRRVLTVTGEIDMSNSRALDAAIVAASGGSGVGADGCGGSEGEGEGGGRLVVDLTAVEYLDSAGLSVLFNHAARIGLVATPLLRSVLTLSGLTELTTVDIVEDDATA